MDQEERVTFNNKTGEAIAAIYCLPDAQQVSILCHGFTDTKEGFHLPALAQALAEKGVGSLRFDFSGNGESEGTFQYAYAKEVEDLRAAVEFLRAEGKKVLAILGHSKGGGEVLLYGGKYDDIPLIVNVSGRFHMREGIKERFGDNIFERLEAEKSIRMKTRSGFSWNLTQEHMNERLSTDMGAAARGITFGNVLTIHGSSDETIPVADAYEFDALIQKHDLFVVDGANHNYTSPESAAALVSKACDFIVGGSMSEK